MHTRPLPALLSVALVSACATTVPVSYTKSTLTVVSVGPAPRGPVLSGRAGGALDVRLGGGVAWTFVEPDPDTQDPVQGTHLVPGGWGQGWVGLGLGQGFEVFVAAGASIGPGTRADTADAPLAAPDTPLGFGELGLRGMFDLRAGGMGGTLSLRFTEIGYTSQLDQCVGVSACRVHELQPPRQDSVVVPTFLATFDAYASLGQHVDFVVSAGFELLQELPTQLSQTERCWATRRPDGTLTDTECDTDGDVSLDGHDADYVLGVILRPGLVWHVNDWLDLQLFLSPVQWRTGRPLQFLAGELGVELHL